MVTSNRYDFKINTMPIKIRIGRVAIGLGTSGSSKPVIVTAVIENAAPTDVVLTFDKTVTGVVAGDFTIAGKTISNCVIAGSVITLTVSVAFVYGDLDQLITYIKDDGNVASFVNQVIENNVSGTWSEQMAVSYWHDLNDHCVWTATQKANILSRLEEQYVIDTFGVAGQNKDVCDFFIFFESVENYTHTAQPWTKAGDILRWNYGGGNIYTQNNIPAHASTTEISITSTDGFVGLTKINTYDNGLRGNLFNIPYYCPNLTYLKMSGAKLLNYWFVGDLTGWQFKNTMTELYLDGNELHGDLSGMYVPDYCQYFYINDNKFTGETPYIRASHSQLFDAYEIQGNRFSVITLDVFGKDIYSFKLQNNCFSSIQISNLISRMVVFYTINVPWYAWAFDIRGTYNGTIIGGEANNDLIALKAIFTSVPLVPKIYYNNSAYLLNELSAPFIALSTDDSRVENITVLKPELDKRGLKCTHFLSKVLIGTATKLSESQVIELKDGGWDLQDHTANHPLLTTLSEAQCRNEFIENSTYFEALGLPEFNIIAYPGGDYNANILNWASDYRNCGRCVGANETGQLIFKENNKLALASIQLNEPLSSSYVEYYKDLIDLAIIKNAGIIFFHHITTEEFGAYFMEILDYALTKGVNIGTINDLYDEL